MFEQNEILSARYHLRRKISSVGYNISTWCACDRETGSEVVLKIYRRVVADACDYPPWNKHDLHSKFIRFRRIYDRLAKLAPGAGLSWVRCHYAPGDEYLIVCRKFYQSPLHEVFTPPQHFSEKLAPLFLDLASGLDCIYRDIGAEMGYFFTWDDIFIDDGRLVIADYGLKNLADIVEASYEGPRPGKIGALAMLKCVIESEVPDFFTDPQRFLALFYIYMRTGHIPFLAACDPNDMVASLTHMSKNFKHYLACAEFDWGAIGTSKEQAILHKSLSRNSGDRFSSCVELVTNLTRV